MKGNGDSTVGGEGRAPFQTAKRKSGGRRAAEIKCGQNAILEGIGGELRRGSYTRQPGGPIAHFGQQGAGQPIHHPSTLPAPGPALLLRGPAWLRSLISPGATPAEEGALSLESSGPP